MMLRKSISTFRESDAFEMLISVNFQGYVMSNKVVERLTSFIERIPNKRFSIAYFHVSL